MVSFWWLLLAFVVGGYAGAVVVGLMALAGEQERPLHGRTARNSRIDVARRRRHPVMQAQAAWPSR